MQIVLAVVIVQVKMTDPWTELTDPLRDRNLRDRVHVTHIKTDPHARIVDFLHQIQKQVRLVVHDVFDVQSEVLGLLVDEIHQNFTECSRCHFGSKITGMNPV